MVVYNPSDGVTGPATRNSNGMPDIIELEPQFNTAPRPGGWPGGFVNPLTPFMPDRDSNGGVDDGATVDKPRPKPPGPGPGGMSLREYIEFQNKQSRQVARGVARDERMGVYDWVRSSFQQWRMPDGFADQVIGIVKDARSPEQALTMIRDTDMYAERFSGNAARIAAGLTPLDEATYLNQEKAYRGYMRAAGLPEGYYDSPSDYADFIVNDVSPEEVRARADLAGELAVTKNPALFKELKSRGLSKGDIAAYMMDPDRALPAIQRKLDRAEMGATARDTGMNFAKGNKFENTLVGKGITADQAKGAMLAASDQKGDLNHLARIQGEKTFTDKGLVKQELGIGGKKTRKARERGRSLASQERAAWAGRAGGGSAAFGPAE